MTTPLKFFGAVAFFALTAFSGYAIVKLNDLQTRQAALEYSHRSLQAQLDKASMQISNNENDFKTALQEHAAETQSAQKKLEEQIKILSELADRRQKKTAQQVEALRQKTDAAFPQAAKFTSQLQKLEYLSARSAEMAVLIGDILDPVRARAASAPKPFSSFDKEWLREATGLINRLAGRHLIRTVIDGREGEDTLNFSGAEDLVVDSTLIRSVEIYNTVNNHSNTITVTAPGLVNLENDRLTIIAEIAKDRVVLDGCLTWTQQETTPDKEFFSSWTATDSEGATRSVRITAGVDTQIQKNCDNRYLNPYRAMLVPFLFMEIRNDQPGVWRVPPPHQRPRGTVFGGIGLQFEPPANAEAMQTAGLVVKDTLGSYPAARAEIKPGDVIIKIDGEGVAYMTFDQALEKMRGPVGKPVTLVYLRKREGEPTQQFEAMLIREMITPP